MNKFIVLSTLLAVAVAKPAQLLLQAPTFYTAAALPYTHITPLAAPILSQYHSQDALGQYAYGYNNELSSKIETKSFDGTTRGAYSYVDAKGEVQSVEYTADAINGFRVAASNLPVAPIDDRKAPEPIMDTPEVALAKAEHLKAIDEAKARNDAAPAMEMESAEAEKKSPMNLSPAVIQLKSEALTAPLNLALPYYYSALPYSNYYNYQQYHYATPFLGNGVYPYATVLARSAAADTTIEALPEPVQDTPEVAQAKIEHMKAVEEVKARNAQ